MTIGSIAVDGVPLAISGWRTVGAARGGRPDQAGSDSGSPPPASSDSCGRPSRATCAPCRCSSTQPRRPPPDVAAGFALTIDGEPVSARVVGVLGASRRSPSGASGFVVADEQTLAAALDAQAPGQGRPDELWISTSHAPGLRAALAAGRFAQLSAAFRTDVQHRLRAAPIARGVLGTLEAATSLSGALAVLGLLISLLGAVRDERDRARPRRARGRPADCGRAAAATSAGRRARRGRGSGDRRAADAARRRERALGGDRRGPAPTTRHRGAVAELGLGRAPARRCRRRVAGDADGRREGGVMTRRSAPPRGSPPSAWTSRRSGSATCSAFTAAARATPPRSRGRRSRSVAGELVCVLGPSGAGKSTLLRVIAGLQTPSAGEVHVLGPEIGRLPRRARACARPRIGFLGQSCRIGRLARSDARGGGRVAAGAARRRAGACSAARGHELLDAAGLARARGARAHELSGGERQRIALCVALAHRPALLLADEPTGELDAASAQAMRTLIAELVRAHRATAILVVSHDHATAAVADRALRIRDGRVVEDRRPARARSSSVAAAGCGFRPNCSLRPASASARKCELWRDGLVISAVGTRRAPRARARRQPAGGAARHSGRLGRPRRWPLDRGGRSAATVPRRRARG